MKRNGGAEKITVILKILCNTTAGGEDHLGCGEVHDATGGDGVQRGAGRGAPLGGGGGRHPGAAVTQLDIQMARGRDVLEIVPLHVTASTINLALWACCKDGFSIQCCMK